jgi:uncharacterized membrane protein YhaH (DUF805 family)
MDFAYLYTSFEGRINRKRFWVGLIILGIVEVVIMFGAAFLTGGSIMMPDSQIRMITSVVQLLFLYPLSALTAKRLHDRNHPTYWVAFFVVPVLLNLLTNLVGITGDPTNVKTLDYLFGIINFVVFVWFFVELGCLRGTVGSNQYGPDPIASPAPAR